MPSASGTRRGAPARSRPEAGPGRPSPTDPVPQPGPDRPAPADPVLEAERAHLESARKYLRLMCENVLALRPLAGDRVSQEYLKADLYRRAEALHDLPDTPLFFGRLNYAAEVGPPAAEVGPPAAEVGPPAAEAGPPAA